MNYNYHYEISELMDDGMSYEEAVAWCEFVCGEDDKRKPIHHTKMKRPTSERTKKWLEKTARKTIGNIQEE